MKPVIGRVYRALGFRSINGFMDWCLTDHAELPAGSAPALQQHPAYRGVAAALGMDTAAFVLRDGGRVAGSAQVSLRRWPGLGRGAMLPRGPVWSDDLSPACRCLAFESLLEALDRWRVAMVVAEPQSDGDDPMKGKGWLRTMTPCTLATLDLTPPVAELRAALHGKWRNRLRRAEGAGLEVFDTSFPDDPDHWLLHAEAAQQRARRYRGLPPEFTRAWRRSAGAGGTRLFGVGPKRAPIAAMLFLLHGRRATYHIGWSGPDGRKTDAHTLLMWQAMLWLRKRGVERLDLDVLDTVNAPGLARFKLGTGARPLPLGATWLRAPGTRLIAPRAA